MTYVTAGLDYAKTNHSSNDAGLVNHEIGTTKVGFVAGFGAEYGLDPRWSVKAEALYVDLGKSSTLSQECRAVDSGPSVVASRPRTQCGSSALA